VVQLVGAWKVDMAWRASRTITDVLGMGILEDAADESYEKERQNVRTRYTTAEADSSHAFDATLTRYHCNIGKLLLVVVVKKVSSMVAACCALAAFAATRKRILGSYSIANRRHDWRTLYVN
jgi:hypothetical protein